MMENLLGFFYDWFQSLFGQNLSYYLWGYDPATSAYSNPNIYNIVGLCTIGVSLLLAILFYYVYNHPRFCNALTWLLSLLANGVLALFVAHGIVYNRYIGGIIPDSLMYERGDQGDIVRFLITESDLWGFGIANLIVAIILFSLFSLALKWGSSNAKYVPF